MIGVLRIVILVLFISQSIAFDIRVLKNVENNAALCRSLHNLKSVLIVDYATYTSVRYCLDQVTSTTSRVVLIDAERGLFDISDWSDQEVLIYQFQQGGIVGYMTNKHQVVGANIDRSQTEHVQKMRNQLTRMDVDTVTYVNRYEWRNTYSLLTVYDIQLFADYAFTQYREPGLFIFHRNDLQHTL